MVSEALGRSTSTLSPEALARDALRVAARRAQLDAGSAQLIRLGTNAVFRLQGRVIARLSRGEDDWEAVARQVAVARWLAREQYPAARVLDVDQPVATHGYCATFWVDISATDETEFAGIEDVARLIRDLHGLEPPASLDLPAFDPFGCAYERLARADQVADDDLGYLSTRLDEDRQRCAELRYELPAGLVHGDANVGNVLVDREGQAVMVDLDGVAIGAREWDLIQTAIFTRFGWHSEAEYARFVVVYGHDVRAWAGYDTMAAARELLMTIWLAGKAHEKPEYADEVVKRVRAMRDGLSRRDWLPY